ncbi:MAG: ABC transporter permease [Oceanicaulis sp.]|nr:ABC transporter permease [Oceanicaulis sp.]
MTIWKHSLLTWRAIFKDKGAMLLLFGAGLVYSFFYPLPYHYEQVQSVPTILVDQDNSTSSRTLSRMLHASPYLDIRQAHNDAGVIQEALWHGDVMAMIIVPSGFHINLLAGRTAELQVASHGGYLLAGSKALMNVTEVAMTMGAGITLQKAQSMGANPQQATDSLQPLVLETRALYNPNDGYGHSIVPAVMVLIIQQTLLIGVTLLLGKKTELGQLPKGSNAYLGMLLTFSIIALLNTLYFFAVAIRIQQYAHLGEFLSLLVFAIVFCVCIAAFALLLGRIFKTRERGLQLLLITSVPMLFVSGYSWPAESLPDLLYYARWILPTTSGIHGFVGITQLGASLADVALELKMLLCLAILMIAAGLISYRQQN